MLENPTGGGVKSYGNPDVRGGSSSFGIPSGRGGGGGAGGGGRSKKRAFRREGVDFFLTNAVINQ